MNYAIDLDAIEARAKAATPDAVTYSYEGLTRGENPRHQFSICNGTWQDEPTRPHRCIAMVYSDSEDDAPDAEFYTNARADVLALLADARAHRTRADAAEADRDAARAEVAALRAIVEGRAEAPDDAEIAAHAAAGGSWLVIFGRYVDAYADADFIRIVRDNNTAARWWPLDATGRPTTWPGTGGGL